MEKIKKFLNEYGVLLNINQQEFFDRAEDNLSIEDYSILVDMLKDSQIELKPEIIFDGYKEYKLIGSNSHIYSFLQDNFERVLTDFNGLNIKRFQGNGHLFIREGIFVTHRRVGDAIIKATYQMVGMESHNFAIDKVVPNLHLKFVDNQGVVTTILTFYLNDLEENNFKVIKFIPNYGIGYDRDNLNDIMDNFIKATKECLGVNN